MSQAQQLKPLRVVFMGTPNFAATILGHLLAWPGAEIVGVYCQPDRPAGRGHKLVAPPVKVLAQEAGLPVFQPLNFKNEADRQGLAALQPDVLAVAAYGLILPQAVLDIPRLAPLNVHASLLPKYRGAAPIQRAIMDGEKESGVSIMRMEAGLDSGPVYSMWSLAVGSHTAGSLHEVMADLGGVMLIDTLTALCEGRAKAVAQDHAQATHAPKFSKQDGHIDWARPAQVVDAHIRAVTPWPGAQAAFLTTEKGICELRIGPGTIGPEIAIYGPNCAPGQLWRLEGGQVGVSCCDKFYILDHVRPQNKKDMAAADFANGYLGKGQGPLARVCPLESR